MKKRSKPKFSPKLKASTLNDIKKFVPRDALNTPVISDYATLPASYQNGGETDPSLWSQFEDSSVGKFVGAKDLRRDGEYFMDTVGKHFGYGNTAEDARRMALDASSVVNPIPDFINAADHAQQGKLLDAGLYAGAAMLPGAAGPIVNKVKPYIKPVIDKGKKIFQKGLQEAAYKGINPVGYNTTKKAVFAPKEFITNSFSSDLSRAYKIGQELRNLEYHPGFPNVAVEKGIHYQFPSLKSAVKKRNAILKKKTKTGEDIEFLEEMDYSLALGKQRLDAWGQGIKGKQPFNSLQKVDDDVYRMPPKMRPSAFSLSQYTTAADDYAASLLDFNSPNAMSPEDFKSLAFDRGVKGNNKFLQHLDQGYMNPLDTRVVEILRRQALDSTPTKLQWPANRLQPFEDRVRLHTVGDNRALRGKYTVDVYPQQGNTRKIVEEDVWDLQPFQNKKYFPKALKNMEIFEAVGRKPFTLRNTYEVNPKTLDVVKSYQTGGQVVSDYDSVWDYKKEGDTVYTKRKDADKWIQPSEGSAAEAAIRNKVFGLIDGPTGPTGPVGAPAPIEPLTGAVGPGAGFHPKSPDSVVTPPKITVEDVLPSMPDIEMPTVEMPEMPSMDISMPDISVPEISVPDISMPDVNLPNVDLPTYEDRVAKNKAVQDKVKSALGSLGDLLPDLPEINFPDFDTPTYEDRVNKNKIVQDKAKRAVKKFRDFLPDLPDVNLPDVDFPSYEDRVERNKVVQDKSRNLLESFGEYLPDLPEMPNMQPVVDRLIEDGNDFIDSAKSEVLEAIDSGTSSLSELKDYLGDMAEDSYSQRLGKNESIQNKVRGTIDKVKSKFELPEAIDAIEKVIKEETFEEMLVRGAQDLNTGVILADDQMYVMKDGVPIKKMPTIVGTSTDTRKGKPDELGYAASLSRLAKNDDGSIRKWETPEGLKTTEEVKRESLFYEYGAGTPAGVYKFTNRPSKGYENYEGYSSGLEAYPGTPENVTYAKYQKGIPYSEGVMDSISSGFEYHPLPKDYNYKFRSEALEDSEISNYLSAGCIQNSDCNNKDLGALLENNASFRDSLIILNSGMGDLSSKAIQELAEKFDMAQSKGEQKEVLQQLAQLSK